MAAHSRIARCKTNCAVTATTPGITTGNSICGRNTAGDFTFTPAAVHGIISKSSTASCSLDIISTFLLKQCIEPLLHPITNIINLALSEGIFPDSFKNAVVRPLLKKHNLPQNALSSYRPISNLNFLSKVLERVICSRINSHLSTFPSICPFQSAYRKFHSTETALLRIHNDLLLASDRKEATALVLLDLTAAFDTVDHQILLTRLNEFFGFSGKAYSMICSYLTNRSQQVTINSHLSTPSLVTTGVPQGSAIEPLLFTLYTTPLGYIFLT